MMIGNLKKSDPNFIIEWEFLIEKSLLMDNPLVFSNKSFTVYQSFEKKDAFCKNLILLVF
jgi:hypothetical protein